VVVGVVALGGLVVALGSVAVVAVVEVDATLVVGPLLAGDLDELPQAPSARTAQMIRLNRAEVLPISTGSGSKTSQR